MLSVPFNMTGLRFSFRRPVAEALAGLLQPAQFRPEHALLYAPVLLGTGIALYFALTFEPSAKIVFNLWILSLGVLLWAQEIYRQKPEIHFPRTLAFIICMMISGFFLAQHRTNNISSPLLTKELKFADVVGTIKEVDILPGGQGQKLTLTNLHIEELKVEETPRTVRIRVRGEQAYAPGQVVKALVSLHPPSAPVSPGAFDFQQHAYFKQLGGIGFSYRPPEIMEDAGQSRFSHFWENLRLAVAAQIKEALPEEGRGVVITFMTGEKSTIPEADLTAMREAGLAHLLAISGLHVGLVAGGIFFFVRLGLAAIPSVALRYPIKKWAAGIAFLFAFFYMFLVGANIPTQRAMMMTGIALFAIIVDRSPFSLHMVAFAALVILLSYPESLMTPSFQMSFAVVTGLVAFYDYFRPQIRGLYSNAGILKKSFLYLAGIIVTTIISGATIAAFVIYHFQMWSMYSELANLMAMPVMGILVMPLAVVSYLLMPFGLADLPLLLMAQGVGWVLSVAHYVSSIDGAVIRFMAFPALDFALLTAGLLLFALGPYVLRIIGFLIIAATVAGLFLQPQSSRIYVSEDLKLTGFYDHQAKQFYASTLRSGRFIRENWVSRLGLTEEDVHKLAEHQQIQCGGEGCRMRVGEYNIAWPATDYAIHADCQWADILIAKTYVPRNCAAKNVIDKRFTRTNGAVEIRFDKSDMDLQTVTEIRGQRPWSAQ